MEKTYHDYYDAISEKAIHVVVGQMQQNKTVLMMAHNFQLVKNFDLIVVLDQRDRRIHIMN